jgi:hypothetical protein
MLGLTLYVDNAIRFCPHCQSYSLVSTPTIRVFGLRLMRFVGVRLYQCRECLKRFLGLGNR